MTRKYKPGTKLKCLLSNTCACTGEEFIEGQIYTIERESKWPRSYKFQEHKNDPGWDYIYIEDPDKFEVVYMKIENWKHEVESND